MKLLAWPLLRQELARQPRRWQLVLLAFELLIALAVVWITPLLSPAVLQFLARVFRLESLTELVLLNDYLSFYLFSFWLVFFELLLMLVIPAEEGYLSLFLSKPLTRRQYLLTRLTPVLGAALLLSLLLILGSGLALPGLTGGAELSWGQYLAGSGISLLLGLVMVLLSLLLILRLRDSYLAIVVAFVCWLLPVLPGSLLMYRPDLFVSYPALRWWIVFPANLIWLKGGIFGLALWLLPLLLLSAGALLWLVTEWLERSEMS